MEQPHQGDGQPTGRPGHPEPMPAPDPGPPQPIPPPEPFPTPEPPKASSAPEPGGAAAVGAEYPPLGAYPGEPGHPQRSAASDTPPQSGPPPSGPSADDEPTQWQPTVPAGPGPEPAGTGWAQQTPPGTSWDQQSQGWEQQQEPWQPEPLVPKRRRTGLWVSLALSVILLLCGGGGVSAYLLLRDSENGEGAPDPATAVNRFLTAVYKDRDANAAGGLVCSEARDAEKMAAKVDEVKGYGTQYDDPQFAWEDPSVASESEERALVSVGITMTTLDEKTARQQLTFTVVKKTGWWVCEVAG